MRHRCIESDHILVECDECGAYAKGIRTEPFDRLWREHMDSHGPRATYTTVTWTTQTLF